ncbi:maltase A3-like [Toxorhynchites rutilus septentrionalis]|uniref:maltase A3-like n=1 Tax=Toxorhynchites rutilus septentrionalis TaxID=329112 RepID=UPI002479A1AC|nr:maltase A3-like [Toxorhynchites rutilus septentrionalis]
MQVPLVVYYLSLCVATLGVELTPKDWWEKAGFYQIYPRSFKDSDGDGIGDLNGITSKLPYLKELGVRAFWMSPINKSPMVDFGYDISDFRAIQPEYGTMQDFENLVKEAHRLNLKVIMDFVPNHSSDKHEWFIKSEARESGYEDFYVWDDGIPNPAGGRNLPPTNWLQAFRRSAWQWSENRQQYYLHQFTVEQPDLNYRNPVVVREMKDVIRFWLDKGVDGFRVDAVPFLFEVVKLQNGSYPNEPTSGLTIDPEDFDYLDHIYTQNQPETLDMVYQWRELVDQYQQENGGETRVLMTEGYTSLEILREYYVSTTTKKHGSHMPFNFGFIADLNRTSGAFDIVKVIQSWMNIVPQGHAANWVMGNHDRPRVGTRFGEERIDAMNMILLSLPGATVTYQGEEIGMTDVRISWEETVDPAACNAGEALYATKSRDPCRTPFQWDDSAMAGFTSGNRTWLPVGSNYRSINVKVEEAVTKSHLNVYKAMMKLREYKTFRHGSVKTRAYNDNVLAIVRELEDHNTYITLVNLGTKIEVLDGVGLASRLPSKMRFEVVGTSSHHIKGGVMATNDIVLLPYESFVLVAKLSHSDRLHEDICEVWLE